MSKAKEGSNVKVHYIGTLNNGDEFDNSYKHGKTLDFEIGDGKLLPKFSNAVIGLSVGDKKNVSLRPEDAYGSPNPHARQVVPQEAFGDQSKKIQVGGAVQGKTEDGRQLVGKVESINEGEVVLDLNHPLAGKQLNFEIELVDIVKK